MPVCTGVAIVGAAAGLITAGSSAASTAAQLGRTSRERDEYRQKYEETDEKLANSEKKRETIEDESRKKDTIIVGLIVVSGVATSQLIDAHGRIVEKEAELAKKHAEYARTKSELADSRNEQAKTQAALDSSQKTVKNILRFGVPAIVIALVLVFFATKQHYYRHSTPAARIIAKAEGARPSAVIP